jgi:hypothetical protein
MDIGAAVEGGIGERTRPASARALGIGGKYGGDTANYEKDQGYAPEKGPAG